MADKIKVLLTCPPMLRMVDEFRPEFEKRGIDLFAANVVQTLSVEELVDLVPQFDGWIIGDDPANRVVFTAGKNGRLKAAVKWGVGVDNVDFAACKDLGIPISNTPRMFGGEVADVAVGYVIGLARQLFEIHEETKAGHWVKPAGISLEGKTVALVGFGDIGKNTARRLNAFGMKIIAYDPFFSPDDSLPAVESAIWPDRLSEADFIVFTCALTKDNRHMLNSNSLFQAKTGVRVVNVARGPLIDETALIEGLRSGKVLSAGLDVFESEPLPLDSPLRQFGHRIIFGSHNGSNTVDAVRRASHRAMDILFGYLGVS